MFRVQRYDTAPWRSFAWIRNTHTSSGPPTSMSVTARDDPAETGESSKMLSPNFFRRAWRGYPFRTDSYSGVSIRSVAMGRTSTFGVARAVPPSARKYTWS